MENANNVGATKSLDEELMAKFDTESEEFNKLSDIDKKFAYVQRGIATVHSINTIETQIRNLSLNIHSCIPDATLEEVKIISSRCDDLNPNELNDLSMGFIQQLLTIEGKTFKFVCPDSFKSKMPMDINELDPLNFNRSMIMTLKTASENVATWNAWKDKLHRAYDDKVSDEVKKIISSPDNMEDYLNEYYNQKINDETVPQEVRDRIKETLKWNDYAYTLEPILENIKHVIRKSGNATSIIYGYRNNAKVTIADANKICKEKNFTFPPHVLSSSIETKLFGEKYKDYEYLLPYLVARYIKYLGVNMTAMQKVFVTQLFTIMLYIIRGDEVDNGGRVKRITERFSPALEELLETIINHL